MDLFIIYLFAIFTCIFQTYSFIYLIYSTNFSAFILNHFTRLIKTCTGSDQLRDQVSQR